MNEEKGRPVQNPDPLTMESTHRVLNFLNLLNSMIMLKTADHRNTEVKELGGEISAFIDCFSRLHTLLTDTGNEDRISTEVFLPKISDTLRTFPLVAEKKIRIEKRIESLKLPGNFILPLSLITIESFTNSLKYAFPEEVPEDRLFRIDFTHNHSSAKLSLQDNGIGLQEAASPKTGATGSGNGFRIMEALAGQIGAKMKISEDEGTRVQVSIPIGEKTASAPESLHR